MINQDFLLKSTGGKLVRGPEENSFSSVTTDSRRIKKNELFFALKGPNFDGHDFVNDAIEKGASGAVVEEIPRDFNHGDKASIIEVRATYKALAELANSWRKKFRNLKVVCITGSNGKTTTKEMTNSILSIRYSVLKNSGNFNNNIGLPLTLLRLTDKHDVCVAELGMNDYGEIRELARIAEPDVGAITNIGRAHLEKLGDLAGVARAKSELVENFNKNNIFIVNNDDPYIREIDNKTDCIKIRFGINSPAVDVFAGSIRTEGLESISFDLNIDGKNLNTRLRGIGKHNVYNALCASAISLSMGLSPEEIQAGLERYTPAYMRLEIIESPQGYKIINDTYNANPDSVTRALEELSSLKNNSRAIAILGDMLELGQNSAKEHRNIGELINDLDIDFTICLGEFSKCIKEGIRKRDNVTHVRSHHEAAELIRQIASKGDLILIKGSRGMRMEKIIQELY